MRILLIAPDYPPIIGGAEIFAEQLAVRLARRHTVHVLTRLPSAAARRANALSNSQIARMETRDNVCIVRVPYLEVPDLRMLTAVPGLLARGCEIVRRVQPDIVHAVTFYPSLVVARLLRSLGHHALVHTEQGLITDVLRRNVTVLDRYGGVLRPLTRWSFAGVDRVMCVSPPVARRVEEFYPHPDRVAIIPNGVDSQVYVPATNRDQLRRRLGMPSDRFVFISTSRLVEKNGVETLVRAMSAMSNDTRPVVLYLVGDGHLRANLERIIATSRLQESVRIVGTIAHNRLPEWLAASDAFVRPSLTEGFGISFVEAMACGLPVIGTTVVTQGGIFQPNVQGFAVAPGDVGELSDYMTRLVTDDGERARMSEAARRRAVECFEWEGIVAQIEDVYHHALEQRSRLRSRASD